MGELLIAGQITDSIYVAALDSPAVTLGIIMGYLDSCWELACPAVRHRAD
ncbi:MAG: hypothetical protein H7338_24580 [Candidatus Sericytochromatia bacterium]|nr:hypothetical protein [Candidatus Sericytochromatia bacterium]